MELKFTMPFNGDKELINKSISNYHTYIDSFYGNFKIGNYGGGRALKKNYIFSKKEIRMIIHKLENKNITFNYVINNGNLLNREFTNKYLSEYSNFLKLLINQGIKLITLSNPFLIVYTKDNFPNIQISGSANLKIRSYEEVKYILDIGCNELTLHYDILKNFTELKKINNSFNVKFKLIANDLYIKDCPWQKGHTRMQSAHGRNNNFKTPYFSYYRNKCVNIRNFFPEEIYKAMWIMPQNINKYIDIGYNHFKLLDRLASTEWNLRVLKAYIEMRPINNLEILLGTYGRSHTINISDYTHSNIPYPINELEAIPNINSRVYNNKVIDYWYSNNHNQICGNCSLCRKLVSENVVYPTALRKKAIENNKKWQSEITKLSFIEKLNCSEIKRIEYK